MRFDLALDPQPAGRSENTDLGGNETVTAWFNGLTDHLTITTESTVETMRGNPYDTCGTARTRCRCTTPTLRWPSWALPRDRLPGPDPARPDRRGERLANGDAQQVPAVLTRHLYERIGKVIRESGEPLTRRRRCAAARLPAETLPSCTSRWRGAGLRGTFRQRLLRRGIETNEYELHAWAELYIPGGGWRGFDPTAGLAVADRHIALAYAAQSQEATPVQGTYRGRATASMPPTSRSRADGLTAERIAVVTGAYSYTGAAVARSLIQRGYTVRTLTNRSVPIGQQDATLETHPLQFADIDSLVSAMAGADVFVNTYWVRYPYVGTEFDQAIRNSGVLFAAAREAGVRRICRSASATLRLRHRSPTTRARRRSRRCSKAASRTQ